MTKSAQSAVARLRAQIEARAGGTGHGAHQGHPWARCGRKDKRNETQASAISACPRGCRNARYWLGVMPTVALNWRVNAL